MNAVRKGLFCSLAALMLITALSQVAAAHWDRPTPPRVSRPVLPAPLPFLA